MSKDTKRADAPRQIIDLYPLPESAIEIVDSAEKSQADGIDQLIEIIDELEIEVFDDGVLDENDVEIVRERVGKEFMPKAIVDIQANFVAGQVFCDRLRKNLPNLCPGKTIQPNEDFNWTYLYAISERWNLPLIMVKLGSREVGGHFTLALKRPEQQPDGSWRVLIYDPLNRGERWQNLPKDWQTNRSGEAEVSMNELAGRATKYDLTLPGEEQMADRAGLLEAKRQKFQFDSNNCGAFSLFAAALRTAMKVDSLDPFCMIGIPKLEQDTIDNDGDIPLPGIEIKTKEELLGY